MKALQYSEYGPSSVLHVVERPEPTPPPGRIRVAVRAVGVNPFDWKVRSGAFGTSPSRLPMVPHSDAAGIVDAVGEGVTDVHPGDEVFGVAEGGAAAEYAILRHWTPKPAHMSFAEAAGLPNVVETAGRALNLLGLPGPQADLAANSDPAGGPGPAANSGPAARPDRAARPGLAANSDPAARPGLAANSDPAARPDPDARPDADARPGRTAPDDDGPVPSDKGPVPGDDGPGPGAGITLVVNGAAGGVGIAAVQIAVARGATVIGTASERNHAFLRELGAIPVTYGPGLAERVRALAPGGVDRALDAAGRGAVAELVTLTPAPADVVSIADFDAPKLGARVTDGSEGRAYDTLHEAAALAAAGRFTMPVERTFPLREAAAAHDLSESGHVRGKVVITL